VDELAVHPRAQGQGIGTALVARALEVGALQDGLSEARAVVAVENLASKRVFVKNGFRATGTEHLLLYRVGGRVPRPRRPGAPPVRVARPGELVALARMLGLGKEGMRRARLAGQRPLPAVHYLVAVEGDELLGGIELVHVKTLQYEGLWVEALAVRERGAAGDRVALALLGAAIERAKCDENLDLVGYLVDPLKRRPYKAAVGEGLSLVRAYNVFVYGW
jgi:GNAT superfamily N-acetyltransferase